MIYLDQKLFLASAGKVTETLSQFLLLDHQQLPRPHSNPQTQKCLNCIEKEAI